VRASEESHRTSVLGSQNLMHGTARLAIMDALMSLARPVLNKTASPIYLDAIKDLSGSRCSSSQWIHKTIISAPASAPRSTTASCRNSGRSWPVHTNKQQQLYCSGSNKCGSRCGHGCCTASAPMPITVTTA
jgi:hypothetical protein